MEHRGYLQVRLWNVYHKKERRFFWSPILEKSPHFRSAVWRFRFSFSRDLGDCRWKELSLACRDTGGGDRGTHYTGCITQQNLWGLPNIPGRVSAGVDILKAQKAVSWKSHSMGKSAPQPHAARLGGGAGCPKGKLSNSSCKRHSRSTALLPSLHFGLKLT